VRRRRTAASAGTTILAIVLVAATGASCGSTASPTATEAATVAPSADQSSTVPLPCDLLLAGVGHLIEPAWRAAGVATGPETDFLDSALSYRDQQIVSLQASSTFWKSVRATVDDDVNADLGLAIDGISWLDDASIESLQTTDASQVFIPISPALDAPGPRLPTGPDARRTIEGYATQQCEIDLTAVPAGQPLSKAEFVARANAACFAYNLDLRTKGDAVPTPTSQDRQAVLDYLGQLLREVVNPASATQLRALRGLTPPATDQAAIIAIIDHLQSQVETMNHDPVAAVKELGKTATPSSTYGPAVDYGLLQCSTQ
jgi:hypothetical protein